MVPIHCWKVEYLKEGSFIELPDSVESEVGQGEGDLLCRNVRGMRASATEYKDLRAHLERLLYHLFIGTYVGSRACNRSSVNLVGEQPERYAFRRTGIRNTCRHSDKIY